MGVAVQRRGCGVKRDLRKLNRRMQRIEDRHRREMTALRNEMLSTVARLTPISGDLGWGYRLTPEGYLVNRTTA